MPHLKLAVAVGLFVSIGAAVPVKRQTVQTYEQIANTTVDTIVNDFRTSGDVTVLRGLIDIAFAALESEAALVSSCLASAGSSQVPGVISVPATAAPIINSIVPAGLAPAPVVSSAIPVLPAPATSVVPVDTYSSLPSTTSTPPGALPFNGVFSGQISSSLLPLSIIGPGPAMSGIFPTGSNGTSTFSTLVSGNSSSILTPAGGGDGAAGNPIRSGLGAATAAGSSAAGGASAPLSPGTSLLNVGAAGIGLGVGGAGASGASTTCTDLLCLGATASNLLTLNAGVLPTSGAALTNLASVGVGLLGGSSLPAAVPALTSGLGSVASGLGSAVSGLVISGANGAVATCTDLVCLQASLPGLLSLSGGVLPTSGANLGNLANVAVGILGGGGSGTTEAPAVTTPILALVSAASQVSSALGGCGDLVCLQASLPGLISLSAGVLPTSGANLGNLLGVGLNLFGGGATSAAATGVPAAATGITTMATNIAGVATSVVMSQVATSISLAAASGVTGVGGAAPTGSWIPVTSWVYINPVV